MRGNWHRTSPVDTVQVHLGQVEFSRISQGQLCDREIHIFEIFGLNILESSVRAKIPAHFDLSVGCMVGAGDEKIAVEEGGFYRNIRSDIHPLGVLPCEWQYF